MVVTADDRLARRPGDYERIDEAITYQDGRVYADARGPKDLYSEDVESMGLFGAVISKMEVRKMQRRMRNSHRARAGQGTPPGGTQPFGWRNDRLALDPDEAALLRRAAKDFAAGRSLNSIVNEWQRLGVVYDPRESVDLHVAPGNAVQSSTVRLAGDQRRAGA